MTNYPEIRKAIYGLLAAALVALSAFQLIDPDQSAAILDVADKLAAAVALVIAFRNVQPTSEAAQLTRTDNGPRPSDGPQPGEEAV